MKMAGPVVHNQFMKDCFCNLELNQYLTKNSNIFAQGHDLLLYTQLWDFLSNRNISLILSNFKFREFVYNYLQKSIKNDSIYQDKNVRMFLYGYIAHHILDSYFHPFIMQYCEDYLPKRNKKWLHGTIETLYDSYFIETRERKKPQQYKLYKNFEYNKVHDPNFIDNINHSIYETYQLKRVGQKFQHAFSSIQSYMYLYRYDPNDFKKKIADITEKFVNLGAKDFFYQENAIEQLKDYMNLNNKAWKNIWSSTTNTQEISNTNFFEIYEQALVITEEIINELEHILNNQSNVSKQKIKSIIPNRSAITGLKCGKKLPFVKY